MNRFTWDLRQNGAVVFPGMIMWAAQPERGPASPPGKYAVRVSANGETQDARLHHRHRSAAEGRWHHRRVPARAVQALVAGPRSRDRSEHGGHQDSRHPRAGRRPPEEDPRTPPRRSAASGRRLLKPLTAVEEEVYQVRNRSSQDPLNYPIRLNNKIAALMGVIESADHRPTDQTYEVFKELSAQLEKQLQQMHATIKTELPRLNAALKRDKVDAVDPDAKPSPPPAEGTKPPQK